MKKKAIIASLFAAGLMSTGPVAAKYVLRTIDPYSTMLFSAAMAFTVLSVVLLIRGRKAPPWKTNKKIYIATVLFFIVIQTIPGLIWFNVLPHLQAIFAIMLKRTQPAVVLIISAIMGLRKIRFSEALLSATAIGGMYFILDKGESFNLTGTEIIYICGAILCVTLWALQFIYARAVFGPLSAIEANRIGLGAYTIIMIPIAFSFGDPLNTRFDPANFAALFYLGVIVLGFGVSAIYYALDTLKPWNVSMILLTGPVAGATAAFIFLGETISPSQIGGTVIVLLSMALSIILEKNRETMMKYTGYKNAAASG